MQIKYSGQEHEHVIESTLELRDTARRIMTIDFILKRINSHSHNSHNASDGFRQILKRNNIFILLLYLPPPVLSLEIWVKLLGLTGHRFIKPLLMYYYI